MRKLLIVLALLGVLAVPTAATAKGPIGDVFCCVGGSTCQIVSRSNGDGYGDGVTVYFHYCSNGVSIYSTYGWADYHTCSVFCSFSGWSYNGSIGNGYHAKANFDNVNYFGIAHLSSSDAACVQVDPYGDVWSC